MVSTYREADLKKDFLDLIKHSYFTQCMKQQAAKEALQMVYSARQQAKAATTKLKKDIVAVKPIHNGNRMALTSAICTFNEAKNAAMFDRWLSLRSIGNKIKIDIPLKLHRVFHKWNSCGRLMKSFVFFKDYVQIVFEIKTGEKKPITNCVGIDKGINALHLYQQVSN